MEEAWEFTVVSETLKLTSDKEDRRYVPVSISRPLLEECGYRCSIPTCRGTSALQLEHIEDWASLDFKKHKFDKMIILCATCHARVTSKEIHKDALRAYKRNLALITGRYSQYEIRLLEKFWTNQTKVKSRTEFTLSVSGGVIQENFTLPAELIPNHDALHIKGLADDGLINLTDLPSFMSAGGLKFHSIKVELSESGRQFIKDYFGGEPISGS